MASTGIFPNTLDPNIDKVFSRLCKDLDSIIVPDLISCIEQHTSQVRLALQTNEFLDILTVEKIANRLIALLQEIEKYQKAKQHLIVGAAMYFVRNNDAQADMDSLLGFDDDVAVLNYVLVELGQSEKRITP